MSKVEAGTVSPPALDLNDLLLDHPGASFIFQLRSDLAIVDCLITPDEGELVLVKNSDGFSVDFFHGQHFFGVITYLIKRTF